MFVIASQIKLTKARVDDRHTPKYKTRVTIDGSRFAPNWDPERRELRLGALVIKKFKWPATNQMSILNAFEENGWPEKIDDPLPPHPDICPKRRLHDTIKCLNRNQKNRILKFRGDGTGRGVLIEITINDRDSQ